MEQITAHSVIITTLIILGIVIASMTVIVINFFYNIGRNPDIQDKLNTPFLIGISLIEVFGLILVGLSACLISK